MPDRAGELSGETEETDPSVETHGPEALTLLDPSAIATPLQVRIDPKTRILLNDLPPVVLERYRRLRTKLIQSGAGTSIRSIAITSAEPEEGKTLTALNLALSFSMLPGFRVVVVDGDLRRASIASWLGVSTEAAGSGLSNLLTGSVEFETIVRKPDDFPVHVVLAGDSPESAAEILHPSHLRTQLARLQEYFHLVIIDTPPVNLVADASLIAQSSHGVLVVARAYATKRKALERAIHDLGGRRILGAVLNGGSDHRDYRQYSNYY